MLKQRKGKKDAVPPPEPDEIEGADEELELEAALDDELELLAADDEDDDEEDDDKKKKKPGEEDDEDETAEAAETEDEEDEDDGDKKKKGRKGRKADLTPVTVLGRVEDPSKEIADLCILAGAPRLAASFISKGYSVQQVRRHLLERQVKRTAETGTGVSTHITGATTRGGGMSELDKAIQQAKQVSLNSGGQIKTSKALEQILAENPQIYEQYEEDRGRLAKIGTRREWQAYVLSTGMRTMRALGLSAEVAPVPR